MHIRVIAVGIFVFISEAAAADRSVIVAAKAELAAKKLAAREQSAEVRVQAREQIVVQTATVLAVIRDDLVESLEIAKAKAREQARKLADEKKDLVKAARRKDGQ